MLSEDEALLELDRELDIRLKNLCRKKSNVSLHDTDKRDGTSIIEDHVSTVTNSYSGRLHQDKSFSPNNDIRLRGNSQLLTKDEDFASECSNANNEATIRKTSCNSERDDVPGINTDKENNENAVSSELVDLEHNRSNNEKENQNFGSEDPDELEEAKDAIFDEFLYTSTQIRIKMLTNKVAALTEALNVMQVECKRLTHAKQEATTAAHTAEMSRRSISKQLQTCQQDAARHQKSNKHLQERVKELTCECQTLRKELSSSQHSECERKNAQSSSHAQLTRSRAQNASLKDQMADLKMKHKDELDDLRSKVANGNARIKELERQQRNYSALVKKQELLIRVLNEQKANIGVAKAAACLEDKFLGVIAPLQPP